MLFPYLQQEEFSEQQVRINLVEKKLENATRDGDERVEKMQRKLDELQVMFKKKEKWVLCLILCTMYIHYIDMYKYKIRILVFEILPKLKCFKTPTFWGL